ncbi:MAG: metallophosphoesterase [Crocinitomicaceae bacterium]|nr:metallophosphoesterase [Crocinitomicaceae bacterium]
MKEVNKQDLPEYTFAVAGHVYGHSQRFTRSVYPPFLKKMKEDIDQFEIQFLVLTGDVVPFPDSANWGKANTELNELGIDWFVAPGNHDYGSVMQDITGKSDHIAFKKDSDLFLVLNTTHAGWTLDSLQIDFVKNQMSQIDSVENIFVFTHQLWWLHNTPAEYNLLRIDTNSDALFNGEKDFWSDAFEIFAAADKNTWFFAGDLGAHEVFKSYYEDHHENFHFYGSGMGSGINDNYLLVSVFKDGSVTVIKREF